MATKAATPWGPATLVEEVSVPQRSGDKRFSSIVQLLEGPKGERFVRFAYTTGGSARRGPVTMRARDIERLVRFAYSTGGTARRGPVTLRARDVERLVSSLAGCPQLAELLGFSGKEGAEESA